MVEPTIEEVRLESLSERATAVNGSGSDPELAACVSESARRPNATALREVFGARRWNSFAYGKSRFDIRPEASQVFEEGDRDVSQRCDKDEVTDRS